jgi:BirA family biotin operon repressor/biotin-[acetyl-CoA-carboxylase] ligase
VAGLAARDAVAEELVSTPDIRWPNDLLVGGRKFAGILTEMHAEPDRIHYAVVGIGDQREPVENAAGAGGDRHVA